MVKFSVLLILLFAATLKESTALNTQGSYQAGGVSQARFSTQHLTVRPSESESKCTWACRRKSKKCYSRCRLCCQGKSCKVKLWLRGCFTKGCKKYIPIRKCSTLCLKIGSCFRRCRKCCKKGQKGSKCSRRCQNQCYTRGCQSRSVFITNSEKRICKRACVRRGKCFSICQRCCRGEQCFNSKCASKCFAAGCRRLKTKCSTKCVRRGYCFKICRRCCTDGRCRITNKCSPKCFYAGCSKALTVSSTKTCNCKPFGNGVGKCYYYLSPESNYCASRKCKQSFRCVAHNTGLKCIKRKVTKKIVSTGGYTCRTQPVSSYTVVPYSVY